MDPTYALKIKTAYSAEARLSKPYKVDPELLAVLTPSGGDWSCVAAPGAITRSVIWQDNEVALVNPRGDLGDDIEGQIAMAIRALPLCDKALRSILVLSQEPNCAALIRDIAECAIGYIEMPAPPISEPEDDDEREVF